MSHFYRYIRPFLFNEKRAELQTSPHGGICLRFEEHPHGGLWFSHARCHSNEVFSKVVAKKIVDGRANKYSSTGNDSMARVDRGDFGTFPYTQNTLELVDHVINHCKTWKAPLDKRWYVTNQYLENEFKELADALELMEYQNDLNFAKAGIWAAGIASTDITGQYRTTWPETRIEFLSQLRHDHEN
jgi:hypothetical protein